MGQRSSREMKEYIKSPLAICGFLQGYLKKRFTKNALDKQYIAQKGFVDVKLYLVQIFTGFI